LNYNLRVDVIEALPQKTLAGYCAIVSPEGVKDLYDKLWRAFLARVDKNEALAERPFYGVCYNLQANGLFEYWLAVEIAPGDLIPRDMIPFHLTGGTYGSTVEAHGISLAYVYHSLMEKWTAPSDYALDWKMPFFEVHVPGRFRWQVVKICLPLQFSVMNYKEYLSVCLGA
jgi:predicted transcriptional regulator YdeE